MLTAEAHSSDDEAHSSDDEAHSSGDEFLERIEAEDDDFRLDIPEITRPAAGEVEGSKCDVSIRGLRSALEACEAALTKDNIQNLNVARQKCIKTRDHLLMENARSDILKLDVILYELNPRIRICFVTEKLKSALAACGDVSTIENIAALKQAAREYKKMLTYMQQYLFRRMLDASGLSESSSIGPAVEMEVGMIKADVARVEKIWADFVPRIRVCISKPGP